MSDFQKQIDDFKQALEKLINEHSIDHRCTTPDYILAEYLVEVMESYRTTKSRLANWFRGEG